MTLTEAATKLRKEHQAIIDAWFARWLKQEKARIGRAFAAAIRSRSDGGGNV